MKATFACIASRSLQQPSTHATAAAAAAATRHALPLYGTLQALCGVTQLPAWAVAARGSPLQRCRSQSTLAAAAGTSLYARDRRRAAPREEAEESFVQDKPATSAKCQAQPTSKRRIIDAASASTSSSTQAATASIFISRPYLTPSEAAPSRSTTRDTDDGLWSSSLPPALLEQLISPIAQDARAGLTATSELSSTLLTHAWSHGAHPSVSASRSSDGTLAASEEARMLILHHICSTTDASRTRDSAQLSSAMSLYHESVRRRFLPPHPQWRALRHLQRKVMHAYIGLLLRVATDHLASYPGAAGGGGGVALRAAVVALRDERVRPTQARYLMRKTLPLLEKGGVGVARETWLELADTMEELLMRGTMGTWAAKVASSSGSDLPEEQQKEEEESTAEGYEDDRGTNKQPGVTGTELHRSLVLLARAQQAELVLRVAQAARSAALFNKAQQQRPLVSSAHAQAHTEHVQWSKPIVQLNTLRSLLHRSNGKGALRFFSLIDLSDRTQDMYHLLFTHWGESTPFYPIYASSNSTHARRLRRAADNATQARAQISAKLWREMCAPEKEDGRALRPSLETFTCRMKSHRKARAVGLIWTDLKAMRGLGLLSTREEAASSSLASKAEEEERTATSATSAHASWLTRLPPPLTLSLLGTLNRSNVPLGALRFATRLLSAHAASRTTHLLHAHTPNSYSTFGTALLNTLLEGAARGNRMSRREKMKWAFRRERRELRYAGAINGHSDVQGEGRMWRVRRRISTPSSATSTSATEPVVHRVASGSALVASSTSRAVQHLRTHQTHPLFLLSPRILRHVALVFHLAYTYTLSFDAISRSILLLPLARRCSSAELRELLRLGFGAPSAWSDESSAVVFTARRMLEALSRHAEQLDELGFGEEARGKKRGVREISVVKLPLLRALLAQAKRRGDGELVRELQTLWNRLKEKIREVELKEGEKQ